MNIYLPTYDEAKSIADRSTNSLFYEIKLNIDGYNLSLFNYRLANYTDFIKYKATELRGLTFIFNEDGSVFKRYLMLHKFWNLNQVDETMYRNIKDDEVISVMSKEDGSLISFNRLPNGKTLARSKMSFESDQAISSNRLYNNNPNIKRIVDWGLDNDIVLFFEYVSHQNKIVLDYMEEDLILLRARNINGDYLDIRDMNIDGINIPEYYDLSIDDILSIGETTIDMEGWVIETDKMFIKHKTKWYTERHHLFTEKINRPDKVIELILNSEIDDVLSQLSDNEIDKDKRNYVTNIEEKVSKYISNNSIVIDDLISKYNGNKKEFAMKYKENEWFFLAIKIIEGREDKYNGIREKILKDTSSYKKSNNWILNNK